MIALLEIEGFGLTRRTEEAREIKGVTECAKRIFEEAHEKLRAQGEPIDPNVTLGEAYEVLGFT